jgi:glycosyltransferase involved in cell wall biosynthesis
MSIAIPNLSVVVLCYRSADTIASFVEPSSSSLERSEPDWEIILVGNYFENSGYQTPQAVKDLAKKKPRVRAVTLVKEGMMGWDMKSGLRAATGKVLSVIDGDGQMPLEDVILTYEKLKNEGFDLVKTYRAERNDGLYRLCISAVYNLVFKTLFPGLHCRDINAKPKTLRREVYEKMNLRSDDWFIDAEIMIEARRMRLKVGEVPTVFHQINSRPSFVKPQAIFEFLRNLIRYRIAEFRKRSNAC